MPSHGHEARSEGPIHLIEVGDIRRRLVIERRDLDRCLVIEVRHAGFSFLATHDARNSDSPYRIRRPGAMTGCRAAVSTTTVDPR